MLKIEGGLINLLQISQLEDLNDTSISEKKISVRRKNDYENTHSQSRAIKKPHKAAFYRGDTPAMTAQS